MPSERLRAVHDDGGLPAETENIRLCSFRFYDADDLDFTVDNELADKEFRLVYDDEPDWGEPEMLVNCPEDELELVYL